MPEPHTTLRGRPSDRTIVPTADFVMGRSTLMVATDVQTTFPEGFPNEPLRSSGLGTRAAMYQLIDGEPGFASFVGWSDEVTL